MIVSGWRIGNPNIKTGTGYGIRLNSNDRDKYFKKEWDSVTIELVKGRVVKVNLSGSFWRDCTELRSKQIGKWMIENRVAPWTKSKPPRLTLEPIEGVILN